MARFFKLCLFLCITVVFFSGCASDEEKKLKHFNKGKAYFEEGEYKSARLEFKNAIQIDPEFAEAYHLLGKTNMEIGKPQDAFKAFSMASKFDPDNIEAHLKLATFYLLGRQLDKAMEKVDIALEKEPDNIHEKLLASL
ncbi:MAG: tetratricopeptide repeat protein [Deltaproteobacteria bacterium]|nr:tetratricopeptide repeat protein [Deltaproteobacteria bacterium]